MSVLMRGECKAEAQTRASQGSAGIARFGHVPATRGRAAANSGTTGPTLPYEAGSIRSAVPRTVRTPLLSKYARSVSVCVRRPPRASAPFSRYATASGASPLLRGPGQCRPSRSLIASEHAPQYPSVSIRDVVLLRFTVTPLCSSLRTISCVRDHSLRAVSS